MQIMLTDGDSEANEATMAAMLGALGSPSRLRIYKLLVRAGQHGMVVGDIRARLGIPGSTLSHHLAALRGVGLITQQREGRELVMAAYYANMDLLLGYMTDECCADAGQKTNGELP